MDSEVVKEAFALSATNGEMSVPTNKMTSSTKVRRQERLVKLTGRAQLVAEKETNFWTTISFGRKQKKMKDDAVSVE